MVLDRLDADRGGEMRLARAGAADQDDIVGVGLLRVLWTGS